MTECTSILSCLSRKRSRTTDTAPWPRSLALSVSLLLFMSCTTENTAFSVQALSPSLLSQHRLVSGLKSMHIPRHIRWCSILSSVRLSLFPLRECARTLVASYDTLLVQQSTMSDSNVDENVNAVGKVEDTEVQIQHHHGSLSHSHAEVDETLPPVVDDVMPNDYGYSASDWLHNIRSVPRSSVLQAIKGPVLTVMLWSTLVSIVYGLLYSKFGASVASRICIGSKLHSFLVSALGLLLVFRTNASYQRFNEGRNIWEQIHSVCRNLSRLAMLYEPDLGSTRRRRVFRLLAAFPYLLHHHVQPQCDATFENSPFGLQAYVPSLTTTKRRRTSSNRVSLVLVDPPQLTCWVDKRSLPWGLFPDSVLSNCLQAANRPLWVCDRLSQEINDVVYTPNFTSIERMAFLSHIEKLSQFVGEAERIHQTAVPLNYARHSLRSLTLWLFSLPLGLVDDFGWWTGPVMGLTAWLLYGIYQIGYQIEDPFQGSLRLSALCDAIYRDVMYGTDFMKRRATAFTVASPEERESWQSLDAAAASIDSIDELGSSY